MTRQHSRSPVDVAGVPVSAAVSVVSGLLAGILGTAVHGNILHLSPHVWIPWGAVLALALLLSLSVWSGTTTRRIWASAVPGIVAYAAAFVLAFGRQDSPLVVLGTTSAIGLSGLLWFGGILLITLLSVVVVGRWWRRRRRAVAQQEAAAEVSQETREASERVSLAADAPAGPPERA